MEGGGEVLGLGLGGKRDFLEGVRILGVWGRN